MTIKLQLGDLRELLMQMKTTSDGDAKIREDTSAVFVSADVRLRFRLRSNGLAFPIQARAAFWCGGELYVGPDHCPLPCDRDCLARVVPVDRLTLTAGRLKMIVLEQLRKIRDSLVLPAPRLDGILKTRTSWSAVDQCGRMWAGGLNATHHRFGADRRKRWARTFQLREAREQSRHWISIVSGSSVTAAPG
jgi:hypothetical protein